MSGPIYRKTASGLAAMRERRSGLDARTRQLLVMVNGTIPLAQLNTQLGGDLQAPLQQLLQLKLIEAVPAPVLPPLPMPPVATRPAPPAPEPAAPPRARRTRPQGLGKPIEPAAARPKAAAPKSAPPDGAWLKTLRARVVPLLEPHFGPGAHDMAQPLLQAADIEAYREALAELQDTLAIYRGRKGALELTKPLSEGL